MFQNSEIQTKQLLRIIILNQMHIWIIEVDQLEPIIITRYYVCDNVNMLMIMGWASWNTAMELTLGFCISELSKYV